MPRYPSDMTTEGAALSGRAPREQRRPEVEQRLIAAVSTVAREGTSFAELSVSRLVREAGLARATFYLYFPDRTAFVLRLADYVRDKITQPASASWTAVLEDRATLESAIIDLLNTFHTEYAVIAALIEASSTDPVIAKQLNADIETLITQSAGVITFGQQRGTFRAELSAYETAAALIWMIERTCYQLGRADDANARSRIARTLTTIVWHALREQRD